MRPSSIVHGAVLGFIVLAAACGSSQSTTSPSTTPTSPTTQVFTSMLYPRGIATESFVLSQNGTIGVTLTNAGSVSALGIGLGIPNPNAPGCVLTTTVTAGASSTAQITTGADAGTYCVSIYDVGFVPPTGVTFTISVSHP